MTDAWLATLVAFHVLGAAVWLGGQIALAPMTRALRGDRDRLRALARAAQPVLWAGLALAAATGLALVGARGLSWGGLVAWKVALVLAAALGGAAHVVSSRRKGPAWVTGGGAALALLAGLALVAVGAVLRVG